MSRTGKMVLSGVLAAIVVIVIYVENILPVNKLSLYTLSSFLISIVIIEAGIRSGFLFYITTSLLIFMIVPDKFSVVPYMMFFGIYGIFKYFIEKINKTAVEMIVKYIVFNVLFFSICFAMILFGLANGIGDFITEKIFLPDMKIPLIFFIIILQILFFVYDYVYSKFIIYYVRYRKR